MHEGKYIPSYGNYIFFLAVASVISFGFILRNQMYLFEFWFFIIIQVWYLRNHFIKKLEKTKNKPDLNAKLRKSRCTKNEVFHKGFLPADLVTLTEEILEMQCFFLFLQRWWIRWLWGEVSRGLFRILKHLRFFFIRFFVQQLTIFAKSYILDIWKVSEYVYDVF